MRIGVALVASGVILVFLSADAPCVGPICGDPTFDPGWLLVGALLGIAGTVRIAGARRSRDTRER